MNILNNVNLSNNELQNALIHPLAIAPANPKKAQIYYNTTDNLIYVYNGSAWVAVGAVTSVNGKTGVVVLTQDDVGNGSTYVRTHNDLTDALVTLINGALQKSGGTMSGAIAMGSNKITGLANGTAATDAAAFGQIPTASSTTPSMDGTGSAGSGTTWARADHVHPSDTSKLSLSGGTMSGNIAMGGNKITGLGDATSAQDAVTKAQLDAAQLGALKPSGSVTFANLPALSASVLNNIYNVTDAFTTTSDFVEGAGKSYPAGTNVAIINTGTASSPVYKYDAYTGIIDLSPYLVRTGDTMSGNLAMGGNLVTGLGAPTADNDAARKKYVDDTVSGLVQTATGTIGTSATSATVNYTGTLINAYATMGGDKVALDITYGNSSVTFTCAQAPSSAVTCTVVYC